MKLVKIKINNRVDRILNFDFDDNTKTHNNSYIIRNRGTGIQELFRISSIPQLIDDEGTKDLTIQVNDTDNELTIVFLPKNVKSKQREELPGLKLDGDNYICERRRCDGSDHFRLNFQYDNKTISLCIYFATSENTYDAIIDFGSEASQAVWLKGNSINPVNLTKNIQDMHAASALHDIKSITELEKFDQFESNTLYKSIYYIKRQISSIPKRAWPRYDGNEWKFLTTSLKAVSKNDYLQLPNSKLIRFEFGNYTNLTIKVGNAERQLTQLKNDIIERILLNNVVKQVLHAIVSNADDEGVYLTLNILMPNVYPIHIAAKKLEWLAKDIEELISGDNESKEEIDKETVSYGIIKAIELRAVSESDASMIGYINKKITVKQQIVSGIYLIMDAGKGTLDFSFMEVKTSGTPYVNRSRAGIVGAGNAVTYGLLVGLVNEYLSINFRDYQNKEEEEKQKLMKEFIYSIYCADLAVLTTLFKAVESYKKVYNKLYQKNVVEPNIKPVDETKASIADLKLDDFIKWISSEQGDGLVETKTNLSKESRAYVTFEIEHVVNEIGQKLEDTIGQTFTGTDGTENKFTDLQGVIFTGRGFLMKELFDKMEAKLKELGIMKRNDQVITLENESDMKGICIDINQKLISNKYDASPSQQTIGIHNNIAESRKKAKTEEKPKEKKHKKKGEGDPIRSDSWGQGWGYREVGNKSVITQSGNISKEGITIYRENIHNDTSISIGGWRYDIDPRFEDKDSTLYFDGINYWLTTKGLAPQGICDDFQDRPTCPLGFESLFPNIVLSGKNEVEIPKKPEPPKHNEVKPTEGDADDNKPDEHVEEKKPISQKKWWQKLIDLFSIPE